MTLRVLLVVDVQNDFCPGGALAVSEGDEVVSLINRLMREGGYDRIVASQDWHPEGHGSFASSHPGRALFDLIDLHGLPQRLWPDHCVQGTDGAHLRADLDLTRIDWVVRKGADPEVDSYSAFADNGGRNPTGLGRYLTEFAHVHDTPLSKLEIDVVGLALDYCVKASAIDAARLGLRTRVILDATRSVDPSPAGARRVIHELAAEHIVVETSREILGPPNERSHLPGHHLRP